LTVKTLLSKNLVWY